jgi:hypothetical protein
VLSRGHKALLWQRRKCAAARICREPANAAPQKARPNGLTPRST